jgi:predicted SAM-dependent methyltransferase
MIDIGHLQPGVPIRIIVGASLQSYPGWISTQEEDLNLLKREDWELSFGDRKIDSILAEHVWEHLDGEEGRHAARICFDFLKPGGMIRCAVPDGYFPDREYQEMIKVGYPKPDDFPAAQHKIVYTYRLLKDVFKSAGFAVELLEYCDEQGIFHYTEWNPEEGFIYRSKRFDHRNKNGALKMVSLILDAKKHDETF